MNDQHKHGEGERYSNDEHAPRQQPDFAMFTKWTDDTFEHLKTLFQFEVAKYVTGRMLALGSVILTFLGILSFFGVQGAIEVAVQNFETRADVLIAEKIEQEIDSQLREMQALIIDANVQIRVAEALMEQSTSAVTNLSDDIRDRLASLTDEIDSQTVEVRGRIDEIKAFSSDLDTLDRQLLTYRQDFQESRKDFGVLVVESRKLVERGGIPFLSIDSLLARLDAASRAFGALGSDKPDAHELAMVRMIIETLGAKEFKQEEEPDKERIVKRLQAIYRLQPPSGFVDYNDDAFREIRVEGINALQSLSMRSPLPKAGILVLAEMLEGVERFGERDGAASALDVLADDDLLEEIDQQVIVRATDALISTLITGDDPEVERLALQTLRRIATMPAFKSRSIDLISEKSREMIKEAVSPSSDEASRKAGAQVLLAIVHTESVEWLEQVRALKVDDSEVVSRIAFVILRQAFPSELVSKAVKDTVLEQEQRAEVEAARRKVAWEARARARRRFQAGRWEAAIEDYLIYLELEPDELGVQRDLAEVYLLAGQYANAEARARITIKSSPTQMVLDQFTIVAALVLAGRPNPEERTRLLELNTTSPMRTGYWSFATLREHLNDENTGTSEEARAEVLELILLIEPS